ncbi:MAG: hypothetical protein ACE5HU_09910 [Acidobacteriota bacterium]
MVNDNRRQWLLLGAMVVVLLIYLRYGGFSFGESPSGPDSLPVIDAAGLENQLKEINTVNPGLVGGQKAGTRTARNLFQYGVHKPPPPPPPDPNEIERQRLAAQDALRNAEEEARRRKALEEARRRAAEEAARRAKEAAERQKPPVEPRQPAKPGKAPPPPIPFKFMGVLGPASSKIGVLLDGEKPILVKEGQVFMEKFKVLNIGVEWTDIGYADPEYKDKKKRIHLGS